MFYLFLENSKILLSNMIEKDVGSIIGPIVWLLGIIINFIFNFISVLTEKHTIGISIIILTIFIRILMLPQGFASQKSMAKMKKIQPEIDKIKKKYGNSKDPEIQKKIGIEQQALFAKHKINMFSGCLPILITIPIFYALSDLMRRLYLYVDKINELYIQICNAVYEIPNVMSVVTPIARPMIPANMLEDMAKAGQAFNLYVPDIFIKFIDKFTPENWETIKSAATDPQTLHNLNELLLKRDDMQNFIGINLVSTAGLAWPGIVIPIISAATSFLLSYLSSKMNPQSGDQASKINQKMLMIVMPVMMFFFTINVSGGVGIYWTASNIFAVVQQIFLNRIFLKRLEGNNAEIIGKASDK